jgi:hypothetical protein
MTSVPPVRLALGVEDRLDEVLQVVRLLEHPDLLAQAGGAGLLPFERRCRDDLRLHLQPLDY